MIVADSVSSDSVPIGRCRFINEPPGVAGALIQKNRLGSQLPTGDIRCDIKVAILDFDHGRRGCGQGRLRLGYWLGGTTNPADRQTDGSEYKNETTYSSRRGELPHAEYDYCIQRVTRLNRDSQGNALR